MDGPEGTPLSQSLKSSDEWRVPQGWVATAPWRPRGDGYEDAVATTARTAAITSAVVSPTTARTFVRFSITANSSPISFPTVLRSTTATIRTPTDRMTKVVPVVLGGWPVDSP